MIDDADFFPTKCPNSSALEAFQSSSHQPVDDCSQIRNCNHLRMLVLLLLDDEVVALRHRGLVRLHLQPIQFWALLLLAHRQTPSAEEKLSVELERVNWTPIRRLRRPFLAAAGQLCAIGEGVVYRPLSCCGCSPSLHWQIVYRLLLQWPLLPSEVEHGAGRTGSSVSLRMCCGSC